MSTPTPPQRRTRKPLFVSTSGRVLTPREVKARKSRSKTARFDDPLADEPIESPTKAARLAVAKNLGEHANHFGHRDWDYSRDLGSLRRVTYFDDHVGYDAPHRKVMRAASRLLGDKRSALVEMFGPSDWRMRWAFAKATLRNGPHQDPDGVLDSGTIITHWEETGEYLQYVQPSVGNLLADLLAARDEDLPEARDRIAAEILRIENRYTARIRSGQVSGLDPAERRKRSRARREPRATSTDAPENQPAPAPEVVETQQD